MPNIRWFGRPYWWRHTTGGSIACRDSEQSVVVLIIWNINPLACMTTMSVTRHLCLLPPRINRPTKPATDCHTGYISGNRNCSGRPGVVRRSPGNAERETQSPHYDDVIGGRCHWQRRQTELMDGKRNIGLRRCWRGRNCSPFRCARNRCALHWPTA